MLMQLGPLAGSRVFVRLIGSTKAEGFRFISGCPIQLTWRYTYQRTENAATFRPQERSALREVAETGKR